MANYLVDLTKPYVPSKVPAHEVLLSPNKVKLEVDLVKTQARTTDVQVPYRDLFDPYKCPADFLPWLASNWSVDLWYDDWPESTKRNIIANIVTLKRQKGTEAGIVGYLSYVNGTIVKSVSPPARGYYQAALTDAQRLAFVNSLPYIQILDYQEGRLPPVATGFMIHDADTFRRKTFIGHGFYRKSYGPSLYGRKAFFVDPLQPLIPPAPCNYTSFVSPGNGQTVEQVLIGYTGSKRAFMRSTPKNPQPESADGVRNFFMRTSGTGTNGAHMQTTRAATNMLSVSLSAGASQLYASFSGYTTYNVVPQRIMQNRTPQSRAFMGSLNVRGQGPSFYGRSGIRAGFMRTTYGSKMIYDRISIYDASRVPQQTKVRTFYNHARFGIAPFNGELTVTFPMFRAKYRQAKYYGRGFLKSWDPTPLYRVLDAIHVAKSKRDKILVQPQTHQTVRLSSSLHLGSFSLGELISTVS